MLHYESLAEDTRKKWQTEARLAEEREVEVLSLQRKIRLLEDRRDKVVDRLEMTTNKGLLEYKEYLWGFGDLWCEM